MLNLLIRLFHFIYSSHLTLCYFLLIPLCVFIGMESTRLTLTKLHLVTIRGGEDILIKYQNFMPIYLISPMLTNVLLMENGRKDPLLFTILQTLASELN